MARARVMQDRTCARPRILLACYALPGALTPEAVGTSSTHWSPEVAMCVPVRLSRLISEDPGITPNQNGLPGLAVVKQIVGALLTWGLVACVAGLVLSVIVWAVARQQGNYGYASGGKTGVLISAAGALLIGGANAIAEFFSGLGGQI